jgi:hypothetical protein
MSIQESWWYFWYWKFRSEVNWYRIQESLIEKIVWQWISPLISMSCETTYLVFEHNVFQEIFTFDSFELDCYWPKSLKLSMNGNRKKLKTISKYWNIWNQILQLYNTGSFVFVIWNVLGFFQSLHKLWVVRLFQCSDRYNCASLAFVQRDSRAASSRSSVQWQLKSPSARSY